jgi:hypothetical protein
MTKALVVTLGLEAAALAVIGLLALDMRAHKRVELLGGVNVWGYRGAVANQKQANEIRIAVVGGDLAFGWGVAAAETLPMFIRRLVALDLDRAGSSIRLITGVNLGAQGLPPAGYAAWIERFAYLRPDVICLLADPDQHQMKEGRFLPDRRSWAFTSFGYSPILPLVVQEKAVITHSSLLRGASAFLAHADAAASSALRVEPRSVGAALESATKTAERVAAMGVVVVMPPAADADAIGVPAIGARVRLVRLAEVPEMSGDTLKLDRFHFSVGGHSRAADAVAPAVLELIRAAEQQGRR